MTTLFQEAVTSYHQLNNTPYYHVKNKNKKKKKVYLYKYAVIVFQVHLLYLGPPTTIKKHTHGHPQHPPHTHLRDEPHDELIFVLDDAFLLEPLSQILHAVASLLSQGPDLVVDLPVPLHLRFVPARLHHALLQITRSFFHLRASKNIAAWGIGARTHARSKTETLRYIPR